MRIAIVALMGLALGACAQQQATAPAGPTTGQIERECGVGAKPFVETWPCHRTGLPAVPVYPDIMGVYIASGNFVAEQIRDGKMTDAEGKLAMAQAKQRLREDTEGRDELLYPRTPTQAVNRPIFSPAAMPPIQVYQPSNDAIPQPQIIYTPQGGIVCQRTGPTSVVCS